MGARARAGTRPLTRTRIRQWMRRPPPVPADDAWKAYGLAGNVLAHFLGIDWVKRHMHADRGSTDFLRQGNWDNIARDDLDRHFEKTITLAELLLNLQHVPGFSSCVTMIAEGDIEAGLAELETAKLLFLYGINFRFIEPMGQRGEDFDFKLSVHGVWVNADTKAKLEGSAPKKSSILNSLKKAVDQLPADQPAFIFLRIPPSWLYPDMLPAYRIIEETVDDFFRSSGRVVSVKMHGDVAPLFEGAPVIPRLAITAEFDNPRARFSNPKGWSIFRGNYTHSRWSSLSWLATGKEPQRLGPPNPLLIWPP